MQNALAVLATTLPLRLPNDSSADAINLVTGKSFSYSSQQCRHNAPTLFMADREVYLEIENPLITVACGMTHLQLVNKLNGVAKR
jgi:hypothetical protein